MIQHPKHVILLELQEAGIPNEKLHELTDRIGEAYDEANPPAAQVNVRGRHAHFELVEPDVTERDEEGES